MRACSPIIGALRRPPAGCPRADQGLPGYMRPLSSCSACRDKLRKRVHVDELLEHESMVNSNATSTVPGTQNSAAAAVEPALRPLIDEPRNRRSYDFSNRIWAIRRGRSSGFPTTMSRLGQLPEARVMTKPDKTAPHGNDRGHSASAYRWVPPRGGGYRPGKNTSASSPPARTSPPGPPPEGPAGASKSAARHGE
jgi:hypothetical protein